VLSAVSDNRQNAADKLTPKPKPNTTNHKTTKPQNYKTTKPQNHKTTKPQDHKTTKPQNHKTTKPQIKP
jgi:hypothetical protein